MQSLSLFLKTFFPFLLFITKEITFKYHMTLVTINEKLFSLKIFILICSFYKLSFFSCPPQHSLAIPRLLLLYYYPLTLLLLYCLLEPLEVNPWPLLSNHSYHPHPLLWRGAPHLSCWEESGVIDSSFGTVGWCRYFQL